MIDSAWTDDEIAAEVDRMYRRAVLEMRRRVEVDGEDWREALRQVREGHALGLCQSVDLERRALSRYGT